ncbi:hypothetical protein D3C85_1805510 [compost metagenome]
MAHPGIGTAYSQDGADQGVRAGRRNAEEPGTQVPDNGGEQQREHHDQTLSRVHAQ